MPASISQGFIRVNGEHAIILSKLDSALLILFSPSYLFPKEFLIFSSASRKNFEADLALFFTTEGLSILMSRDIDNFVLELSYERTRSVNIMSISVIVKFSSDSCGMCDHF